MDQFTRRIIGFGIHRGTVDGPSWCSMLQRAIQGQALPRYHSTPNPRLRMPVPQAQYSSGSASDDRFPTAHHRIARSKEAPRRFHCVSETRSEWMPAKILLHDRWLRPDDRERVCHAQGRYQLFPKSLSHIVDVLRILEIHVHSKTGCQAD